MKLTAVCLGAARGVQAAQASRLATQAVRLPKVAMSLKANCQTSLAWQLVVADVAQVVYQKRWCGERWQGRDELGGEEVGGGDVCGAKERGERRRLVSSSSSLNSSPSQHLFAAFLIRFAGVLYGSDRTVAAGGCGCSGASAGTCGPGAKDGSALEALVVVALLHRQ